MLIKNPSLKEVFPEPPMAGLRQGPNLRRLLCRARLHPTPSSWPTRATQTAPGWRPCSHSSGTRKQCPTCPLAMEPTSSVTGLVTGYTHKIRDRVNCQSQNIIYYWKCNKTNCESYPNCEYIGKSCRSFQARILEHKYYATSERTSWEPFQWRKPQCC